MIDATKLTPFLPAMDQMTLWRVLMGISAFSFWLFFAWFIGFVHPELARADNVNDLRHEQKEERILARHRDFCRADRGSDRADYFLQRRNELIREYFAIDGTTFDSTKLPPCDVLSPTE